MRCALGGGKELDDLLDMLVKKDVVVGLFLKEVITTGINEAYPCVGLLLRESKDIYSNGCAVEEVGR